jgi:3-hydroxyisobutyrate dehydrogenase-like beta-hydroxyacid dehydrogenase
MVKDLNAAQEFAAFSGVSMPVTDLVGAIHRQFVAAGFGDADNCVLMKQFDDPGIALGKK